MKASVCVLIRMGAIFALWPYLLGCSHGSGNGSGTSGGGTSGNPDTSLIGNWQFQATSNGGTQPFTTLSGFVNEQGLEGDSTAVTASLQVQSSSCFGLASVLDFQGFTKNPLSQFTSIPFDSQVVALGLSQQCTNVSLCGTYSITGGCGDQESGTIVGTRFTQLAGTFSSAASSPVGIKIAITQSSQGTGQGNFQVSGSMNFSGLICASSAVIDPTQSFVSGSSLHLVGATNGAGSPLLTIEATINPSATTMTLKSASAASNNCFQSLNGANLSNP